MPDGIPRTPGFRLDGRGAVVAGGGRGIGMAIAIALAEAGARVTVMSRSEDELAEVVAAIGEEGGAAAAVACDLGDPDGVARAFASVGEVDVFVNSVGFNVPQPFVEVDPETLGTVLGANVRTAFLGSQHAARRMIEQGRGGAIIHVTSDFGHVGSDLDRTAYCAAKHAVEGLVKASALELAPHGIRVNSLAPTFIETKLTKPFLARPGFREHVLSQIPLGRIGRLEDVMGAAVFLASPSAELITGTSILIDGGWTAR
jgi:NAD(P)-dependent dehydrogenase (short-subunit alcohol dehydrogenase family)